MTSMLNRVLFLIGVVCCGGSFFVWSVFVPLSVHNALVLDRSEYDFGIVPPKSTREARFHIQNRHPASIEFTGVVASCSCTTPKLAGRTLMPDQSTEVNVMVQFGQSAGPVRQSVELQYVVGDEQRAHTLVLPVMAVVGTDLVLKEP